MKKLASLLALVLLLAGATPALAGDDRPIAYEKLPAAARQFITAHFADTRLSYAKVDSEWWDTTYEVVFVDGRKVEFARDGSWREVSCKYAEVPAGIIPPSIRDYVASPHPGQKIIQIERDRRTCEVKLDGGLDLTFDRDYRLIGIDD